MASVGEETDTGYLEGYQISSKQKRKKDDESAMLYTNNKGKFNLLAASLVPAVALGINSSISAVTEST